MIYSIIAIYEDGVLRPLTPLTLPEHTQVQIQVQPARETPAPPTEHRRRIYEALVAAGLSLPLPDAPPVSGLLSTKQRRELAERFSPSTERPLSDLIIEEREER